MNLVTNQPDSNGARTRIPNGVDREGAQGAEGSGPSSNSPRATESANPASRDESQHSFAPAEEPQLDPQTRKQATRAMLKYGAARLGLFLGLTIVIQALAVLIGAQVPLVVSALLALLVALPLSMLIFKKLRIETTEAVAKLAQQRKARKEWVNRELAGR